jgi:phasin family protein
LPLDPFAALHYVALQQKERIVADQKTITDTDTQATEAATAAKQAIAAAADQAASVAGEATKASAKAAIKPAAKTARKARVAKAPAAVIAAVKKTNKRAKAAARRAKNKAAPAVDTQIERTTTMTYDFTKMFVTPELPGADKFQALFGDAGERGQELVRKSQAAAEEMAEIAKANLEAFAEAGRIAATGARTLGQDMLASGREGLEQASGAVRTLADAKSPTEFLQIQAELARTSFDRAVAESSKFAEAFVKLAGETVQPLSTRATLNAERISEIAA